MNTWKASKTSRTLFRKNEASVGFVFFPSRCWIQSNGLLGSSLAIFFEFVSSSIPGMVDQATKGERRVKEEELRMKKVAVNISKDVKKLWTKIEKLVL
ncbi:hypothetical protein LXL04_007901 [Taraxacum kok-saghyz]